MDNYRNVIRFRGNPNNKLNNIYFSTVRGNPSYKQKIGCVFSVFCNELFVKKAVLLKVEVVKLKDLDDVFIYLDSAVTKEDYIKEFLMFYNFYDVDVVDFYRLLFKSL